jgi:hypothetical protein
MKRKHIVLLAAYLILAGCSSRKEDPGPATQPVTGRVVYPDGSAYKAGGTISLDPVDKTGLPALGRIDDEGHFTLNIIGKKGKQEGATAGEFIATIVPDQGQSQGAGPRRARGTYRIKADEPNELKIILDRAK